MNIFEVQYITDLGAVQKMHMLMKDQRQARMAFTKIKGPYKYQVMSVMEKSYVKSR